MKMEDQVVSAELAKVLKELGVKQDSLFYWIQRGNYPDDWSDAFLETKEDVAKYEMNSDGQCSAPTVAELGKMLPSGFYTYYDDFDGWTCSSSWSFCDRSLSDIRMRSSDILWGPCIPARQCRYTQEAKTEANARAKMVAYLLKEGILKVEEMRK